MNPYVNKSGQDILYYPKCEKASQLRQKIKDIKTAIVYLKLRDEGCKKREAINFCQKTVCKIDTSKRVDGPANCRKLKPLQCKGLQVNGWELSGNREYEMGKRFRNFNQLGIHSDEDEAKITNIIENKMKGNSHDYLYRIKILDNYLQEIEQKCQLPKFDYNLLSLKINKMIQEFHEFNEQHAYHINVNGINLYEIFQDYPNSKEEKEKYNSNLINLFDTFSHLYNKEQLQNQIKFGKMQSQPPIQQQQQQQPILEKQRFSIAALDINKNSFGILNSSRNSLPTSKLQLQLSIGDNEDKEGGNEQNNLFQQNQQFVQPKAPKNLILQRQQTKSIFNTFIQSSDKKDQVITPTSGKSTPKLKFIDLKIGQNKFQNFNEQQTQITGFSGAFNNNHDYSIRKSASVHKCIPFQKQMEFPKKIDWLIDSAINDRQISPRSSYRCDNQLNQQIEKIQKFKQKLEKKTMTNFYDSNSSFGFKTHSEFFKHQKNKVKLSQQNIFSKSNTTNYSHLYSTGLTSHP